LATVQLDELHAVSWGGQQIRLEIDQAESQSSKEASCSQLCLAFLVMEFTSFFTFRRTISVPAMEQNVMSPLRSTLRDCKVSRDGMRRYIHDIWRPLALLVVTVSLTAVFFTNYDPYSSMQSRYDWFFCNADGTLEVVNDAYRPS
jgi:hypothetical protein